MTLAANLLSDKIKIVSLDDMSATEIKQIDVRLKTLLLCTETTIPGSRAFGLARNYLDEPINIAANRMAAEIQEKADVYIPEINIASVIGEYGVDGKLETTIEIERRGESD